MKEKQPAEFILLGTGEQPASAIFSDLVRAKVFRVELEYLLLRKDIVRVQKKELSDIYLPEEEQAQYYEDLAESVTRIITSKKWVDFREQIGYGRFNLLKYLASGEYTLRLRSIPVTIKEGTNLLSPVDESVVDVRFNHQDIAAEMQLYLPGAKPNEPTTDDIYIVSVLKSQMRKSPKVFYKILNAHVVRNGESKVIPFNREG
jgi:hypothetical protein